MDTRAPVWNGNRHILPCQGAPGISQHSRAERKWNKRTKTAVFIEVFLWKTRVNIGSTLSIGRRDAVQSRNLAWIPTDRQQHWIASSLSPSHRLLSRWSTPTTHAKADKTRNKNTIPNDVLILRFGAFNGNVVPEKKYTGSKLIYLQQRTDNVK